MIRYFRGSLLFSVICLILAAFIGYQPAHSFSQAFSSVFLCLVLGFLEVSLSFDNTVVNASVLQTMSEIWQKRFLTWGLLIAVFGMRLIFPVMIVCMAGHLGPLSAINLALAHPHQYAKILAEAHTAIMGFGGAFLFMVGLDFFFNEEKKIHWIKFIESPLQKLSSCQGVEIAVVLVALYVVSQFLPQSEALTFLTSSMFGLITYIAVQSIGQLLEAPKGAPQQVAKAGLGAFLYLEMMDASFSFDGVIGAFAITTNLFIIMLGLGIGAMFVRSLTMVLVKTGTLAEYRYLEHGAFWAILALAIIMMISTFYEIPEIITGLIGIGLIGLSYLSSIKKIR
ncbi:DUF475 domain-containing protein [Aristophania vespae]|uniref:DUF475 domain-containing protein n=1 Tax=Aristophania vespae TaxID=2697033 RepID=UPI0023517DDD|nr:DUF475 domain-containing protein [Aristophania vespae]UMM64178.1 hypothetical protein DM15PD_11730 [Aristophania vespae]